MNKRTLYGLGAGLLLPCLFAAAFHAHPAKARVQGPEASLFSAYPNSRAFNDIVHEHLHPTTNALIAGTWFLNGKPSIAMECHIDISGKGYTVRSVFDWAEQCYKPLQLNARELKSLQAALRSLPPSSSTPPWDRLLILSYQRDGVWVTRLYDRGHLPTSVQKVYQIAGASVSNLSGSATDGAT